MKMNSWELFLFIGTMQLTSVINLLVEHGLFDYKIYLSASFEILNFATNLI